jgi:hypothetical protein
MVSGLFAILKWASGFIRKQMDLSHTTLKECSDNMVHSVDKLSTKLEQHIMMNNADHENIKAQIDEMAKKNSNGKSNVYHQS